MNYTIENWFPKPIYYADDVCLEFLDQFEQEVKRIVDTNGAKKSQYLGVQSTHMTASELQLNPVFRPLSEAIKSHVFEFGSALGYSPATAFKFYIGNMWANVSGKHEYNFPHTHPGSIISGAFYIKTVPENVIAFYDKYDTIQLPENHTAYDNKPIEYRCVPGRLLLFKSDFVHGNPAQQSEGEKIVISFNMIAGL